jgi:hypothetical protein
MSHKTFRFPMSEKTSNHMRAPHSASFVAAMRNVFGNENVSVLYVKENDLLIGEPSAAGAPCLTFSVQEEPKAKKRKAA